MIKTLALLYLVFWLILLVLGSFVSLNFILSSQVAFFSSLLILFATFKSYQRRVNASMRDDKDEILAMQKELDDEEEEEWGEQDSQYKQGEDVKEFSLKNEKERLKKQKIKLKDLNLTAAFVPYRLLAYAVLILGFLVLKRKEMLDIAGILIGLAPMPIGAFLFGVVSKNVK
ncbi:hypothetical protein [Campylobacter californiensis]|uniref:hypothetical protein n=1 Tax=Campylobacter californiensis TaxID=1032243 RepID=UPI0014737ED4|nr:hypothetical protein [Campylobacter sp. RM12916]MBE3609908.1 hypothetical protein [Campylobacter sp. RM12916]